MKRRSPILAACYFCLALPARPCVTSKGMPFRDPSSLRGERLIFHRVRWEAAGLKLPKPRGWRA